MALRFTNCPSVADGRILADAPPIESYVERFREWIVQKALPLWAAAGFDAERGSFVERLTLEGMPLVSTRRRAMVQARQIYVFSHAALLNWRPEARPLALKAAHMLIDRYHRVDGEPGWAFSIDPDSTVPNARRELYTQSFVLFGLAWAHKLEPDPRFRSTAQATLDALDQHFASPTGGYYSALPCEPGSREQNPHMHLFEAMLAWFEATGDEIFLSRAREMHTIMASRFFQREKGVLAEYFDGSWNPRHGVAGRICEPGHHFEWSWLLRRYSALAGQGDSSIARALKAFGDRHGFDADGFVVDELLDDGTVHKDSRRCWPHTKSIKAEVAAFEAGDRDAGRRAGKMIERLLSVFLGRPVEGGWMDHVDAEGAPLVDFMPASTLYHVFLAAAEADRVWGKADVTGER